MVLNEELRKKTRKHEKKFNRIITLDDGVNDKKVEFHVHANSYPHRSTMGGGRGRGGVAVTVIKLSIKHKHNKFVIMLKRESVKISWQTW